MGCLTHNIHTRLDEYPKNNITVEKLDTLRYDHCSLLKTRYMELKWKSLLKAVVIYGPLLMIKV